MCGFAGTISPGLQTESYPILLRKMGAPITHRGPDDEVSGLMRTKT